MATLPMKNGAGATRDTIEHAHYALDMAVKNAKRVKKGWSRYSILNMPK